MTTRVATRWPKSSTRKPPKSWGRTGGNEALQSRDGRFWLVEVPELGHYTQARTLKEIRPMVVDLIQIMTDEPADSFNVRVEPVIPARCGRVSSEA